MKNILIVIALFLAVVGCSKKEEGKVLATIDGETITVQEFNNELDKIPMNMKMLVASQSGKRNFLDRMVVKRLLLREAKKEDIDKDKQFQDRLSDIREQLLIESLLKKKVNIADKIPDDEVKKYYEAHKEEFKKEAEIHTRQILVKTEGEAKEIQTRLAKGEDFAELAKKYSIDPSAKQTGGDIGFHPKGTLIPEYEQVAFKMTKEGQVSAPVKTQLGYHIIKLEGVKPAQYMPLEQVKDFAKQKMAQEKQTETIEKYIEELKKTSKVTVNEDVLKEETKKPEGAEKTEAPKPEEGAAKPEVKTEQPPIQTPAKQEAAPKK